MSIYGLTKEELEAYFIDGGSKKFHADQLFNWLYEKRIASFNDASNLSIEMRNKLNKDFGFFDMKLIKSETGNDVSKYLFLLEDGEHIEAVLMNHDYGLSICVSSQVGCNMGCRFCESGRRKKVRNLKAGEIVEQILLIEKEIGKKISHVVVMGIGEPFDNYEEIIKFIKIINDAKGLAIGSRHITVSTCGIAPKIREFANLDLQVNLAVSLHAPNDILRSSIMPINKKYNIKEVIEALKYYYDKTNRRITFEYIMLDGINDKEEDALELVKLVRNLNCYINLIPYNETENIGYKRSNMVQIMRFYDILKTNKINVTIRREFGGTISAACGQLRSKEEIS
jgi:23S rRNA (adenine2503-C2)-methyltransferase